MALSSKETILCHLGNVFCSKLASKQLLNPCFLQYVYHIIKTLISMVLVPPLRISLRNFEIGEENIMVREKKIYINIRKSQRLIGKKCMHIFKFINDGMIFAKDGIIWII